MTEKAGDALAKNVDAVKRAAKAATAAARSRSANISLDRIGHHPAHQLAADVADLIGVSMIAVRELAARYLQEVDGGKSPGLPRAVFV